MNADQAGPAPQSRPGTRNSRVRPANRNASHQIARHPTPGGDSHGISRAICPTLGYHRKRRTSRPVLENLEQRLVLSLGPPSQVAIAIEPPSSPIVQGGVFGTIAAVEDSGGNIDTGFTGTGTISLKSGPAGATFTPVTVSFVNGEATFDGLSLSQLSDGTDYVFQVTTTIPSVGTVTTDTTGLNVGIAATPNVGNYYPLPTDASLRGDIGAADANGDATNNIVWIYDAFYPINNGQIDIDNASSLPGKTLNMVGVFTDSTTDPVPYTGRVGVGSDAPSRLFEIIGGSTLNVNATGINFYGGQAVDDGGLTIPGIDAAGGAFLIDGGNVHMTSGGILSGSAIGSAGTSGAKALPTAIAARRAEREVTAATAASPLAAASSSTPAVSR